MIGKGNWTKPPTFEETVEYIISTPDEVSNQHFKSATSICSPCFYKYDAVTKIESFDTDNGYIIHKINASNMVESNTHIHIVSTEKDLENKYWKKFDHFYSQISEKLKDELFKRYEDDFQIFGYSFDENGYPISRD